MGKGVNVSISQCGGISLLMLNTHGNVSILLQS